MFATSGASPDHVVLSSNALVGLGSRLRGGPCRVFGPDPKVRIGEGASYVYPDATVVCGGPVYDRGVLLNPTVVLEVLSPSTEGYDRGFKFERYRRLGTLRPYVLVAQDRRHVDVFVRAASGRWEVAEPLADGALTLDELYEGVRFGDPDVAG